MAVGWNGADPVVQVDADNYALGTAFKANEDVTLTHVRIWAGASEVNLSGRTGKIWSTGGQELASVALPSDLPTGWSTHALSVPVERLQNQQWIVAYDTGGNYGFLNQGLNADVPSADGAVTALGFAGAPGGVNGRFHNTPGEFPQSGNASHGFYGADVVYDLGIGGNTAPVIQSTTVIASSLTATAQINATDEEGLTGASYRFVWGDGSADSVTNHPTNSAQHTYALPGIYPILMSVTDSEGLSDFAANFIQVIESAAGQVSASDILDLLVSRTKRLKQFAAVVKHEPRSAPTKFPTAAFFLGAPNAAPGGFQTIKRVSSLSHAGMRMDVICRIYMDSKKPVPYGDSPAHLDNIDQVLLEYAESILRECHAHVSFGIQDSGIWTDANGADSDGLGGLIGYLDQDANKFRIVEIYIPVILTSYFQQGNP